MNTDHVFAALASSPRRQILAYLSATDMTAGEIAARFSMTKPALSKHLKQLELAGLIIGEREGQFVRYRLAEDNLIGTLYTHLATFCPISSGLKKESKKLAQEKKAAKKTVQR